ncbi:MAG: MotA/TolQ/ExbB proton channel family protein [Phycisphaeraceae bacterium]|nr:MotA/TolQ/ExbB proton channel family protein [Phycisphaeraceae bacterium]
MPTTAPCQRQNQERVITDDTLPRPGLKDRSETAIAVRMVRPMLLVLLIWPAAPAAAADGGALRSGLWPLFRQSFDIFTIVLMIGSLFAVGLIVRCALDLRRRVLLPSGSVQRIEELSAARKTDELRQVLKSDESILGEIVRASVNHPTGTRSGMREAAEIASTEVYARLARRIDLLNVIGNLGPLVGLAGTVWGMILAFTSLGEAGGQANPGQLSVGIAKALFHTLLGLLLAIPCLLAYGVFRGRAEAISTEVMTMGSRVIERLPANDESAKST